MTTAEVRMAATAANLFLAAVVLGAIAFKPSPVMAQQQHLASLAYPIAVEKQTLREPSKLSSNNVRISHAVSMKSAAEEFCAFTMVPTLIERRHSCMWLCEEGSAQAFERRPEWEQ